MLNKYNTFHFFKDFASATSSATLVTPPSGQAIRLVGYAITSSASGTITLDVGGNNVFKDYVSDWGGANLAATQETPIVLGKDDEALKLTSASVTSYAVTAWGYFE